MSKIAVAVVVEAAGAVEEAVEAIVGIEAEAVAVEEVVSMTMSAGTAIAKGTMKETARQNSELRLGGKPGKGEVMLPVLLTIPAIPVISHKLSSPQAPNLNHNNRLPMLLLKLKILLGILPSKMIHMDGNEAGYLTLVQVTS